MKMRIFTFFLLIVCITACEKEVANFDRFENEINIYKDPFIGYWKTDSTQTNPFYLAILKEPNSNGYNAFLCFNSNTNPDLYYGYYDENYATLWLINSANNQTERALVFKDGKVNLYFYNCLSCGVYTFVKSQWNSVCGDIE